MPPLARAITALALLALLPGCLMVMRHAEPVTAAYLAGETDEDKLPEDPALLAQPFYFLADAPTPRFFARLAGRKFAFTRDISVDGRRAARPVAFAFDPSGAAQMTVDAIAYQVRFAELAPGAALFIAEIARPDGGEYVSMLTFCRLLGAKLTCLDPAEVTRVAQTVYAEPIAAAADSGRPFRLAPQIDRFAPPDPGADYPPGLVVHGRFAPQDLAPIARKVLAAAPPAALTSFAFN